jgi:HAD superfamily hydrolase (TIGR01484 family)
LDGTLLDDAGNLQVGFYDTIKMLNEKGITFVPASGRLYSTLNHTFSNANFPLLFIAHNGALVQYSNDGKEIYKNTISPTQVKKAVKLLKQLNLQIYLCTKTFAYVENPSQIMRNSFEKGDLPIVLVDNLEDTFSDIYRIGVYDPNKIKSSTFNKI